MANLYTTLAGKNVRSAIGLASVTGLNFWYPAGPIEKYVDWFKKWIDYGIGFIVMPSVGTTCDETGKEIYTNPPYRELYCRTQWKSLGGLGGTYYFTTGTTPTPPVDHGIKIIEKIKKFTPPDVPLIASLFPQVPPNIYAVMAKRLESAGADMIEINGGCPIAPMQRELSENIEIEEKFGMFLGNSRTHMKSVVEAVTKAVKIPVGVKLTPQAGYPGIMAVADASIKAGAKYIKTIHTPMAILPPDIHNGGKSFWPLLKDYGFNPIATIGGGETMRILNNFNTAMMVSFFSEKVDIVASGGIDNGEHVIQSIMLGAKTVEIASAFIWHGISQIKKINKFVSDYMDQYGFNNIENFRGCALKYIKPWPDIIQYIRQSKMAADVDLTKCIRCGICIENLCNAITFKDNSVRIKKDDCAACGLCMMVCPKGAISFTTYDKSIQDRINLGP